MFRSPVILHIRSPCHSWLFLFFNFMFEIPFNCKAIMCIRSEKYTSFSLTNPEFTWIDSMQTSFDVMIQACLSEDDIRHKRPCLATFPNTKRVENTMSRGRVFLINSRSEVFVNVVRHCVECLTLNQNLSQSVLIAPSGA